MDINFFAQWLSFIFFSFSVLVFFYSFLKNTFLMNDADREKLDTVAQNRKFRLVSAWAYMLVALHMVLGLKYVLQINPGLAAAHVGISGIEMLVLSVVGFVSERKFKVFLVEFLPAFLGFFFLSFHIMASIGVI